MIRPHCHARIACAIALALTAAGCGGTKDGTDTSAAVASTPVARNRSAEEDLADITKYKLSMDKIDKYIAAQRNIARKAAAMSPAEREAMKAKDDGDDSSNDNLDDMARKIESNPVMSAAVRDAGLSAREFAVITMSMMQSAMAASVLKMRPNDDQDSLAREMKANMDNIRFYQQHEAEIVRKTTELAAEMKRLGADQ
jgi:hypothetical protein